MTAIPHHDEPLFNEPRLKYIVWPTTDQERRYEKMYEQARACLWTSDEIDLSCDYRDWQERLTEDERRILGEVLTFFLCADGLVNNNLLQLMGAVRMTEALRFYGLQLFIEQEHATVYSKFIQLFFPPEEWERRLAIFENFPAVRRLVEWGERYFDRPMVEPLDAVERIVASAIFEMIFLSGNFAIVFWLKEKGGGLLPGLMQANSFIARDERLHGEFACALYRDLRQGLETDRLKRIICTAVEALCAFYEEIFGETKLEGLPLKALCDYICFIASKLYDALSPGAAPLYPEVSVNPLPFMDRISMPSKANFFEVKNTNYRMDTLF